MLRADEIMKVAVRRRLPISRQVAVVLAANGMTISELASQLGLAQPNLSRWLAQPTGRGSTGPAVAAATGIDLEPASR